MQQITQDQSIGGGGHGGIWLRTGSREATLLLLNPLNSPWESRLANLCANGFFLPGAAAARGVLDGQGGRQPGCLQVKRTRVSHFTRDLKFISNTRNSSLSLSLLLLFFSTDILIWMRLAGSKLRIVLIKSQLAGNTCQSLPLFLKLVL